MVATPIWNLGDVTLRALETLKQADAIACEDTRVTAKLLAKYDIKKPLLIYHSQSGSLAATRILSQLGEGKHVALVTDAGTPGISDPGSELVSLVRERLNDTVRIEAIPGRLGLVEEGGRPFIVSLLEAGDGRIQGGLGAIDALLSVGDILGLGPGLQDR